MAKKSNKKHTKQNATSRSDLATKMGVATAVNHSKGMSNYHSFVSVSVVAIAILSAWIVRFPLNDGASILNDHKVIENKTLEEAITLTIPTERAVTSVSAVPVSIAAFHNVDDSSSQRAGLARYLQYDDGYSTCLVKSDLTADTFEVWDLKENKLKYLELIANIQDHWRMQVPSEGTLPAFDLMTSTCRVISLNHDDFDAVETLKHIIVSGGDMTLKKHGNALEYRTMACLSRFFEMSLGTVPSPQEDTLRMMWYEIAVAAKNAAQEEAPIPLRFGWIELRKPESFKYSYYQKIGVKETTWIRPTARSGEIGVTPKDNETKISLLVRKTPCPMENSASLLTT